MITANGIMVTLADNGTQASVNGLFGRLVNNKITISNCLTFPVITWHYF